MGIIWVVYIVYYIFIYLTILIWIDIIKFLFFKKNEYTFTYLFKNYNENKYYDKILKLFDDDEYNICKNYEGVIEQELIIIGKSFFFCNKCKWKANRFFDFIPKVEVNNSIDNLNTDPDLKLNNPYISVIFLNTEQTINYSIPCKLSDTFETIENALYKENPDLKKKNFFSLLEVFQ